jgi:hypothetical protein
VTDPDELERWRDILARLQRGPAPQGEEFELCREVIAAAPGTAEGCEAARALLEGAIGDATTNIADAHEVMRLLKAANRGAVDIADLLAAR